MTVEVRARVRGSGLIWNRAKYLCTLVEVYIHNVLRFCKENRPACSCFIRTLIPGGMVGP